MLLTCVLGSRADIAASPRSLCPATDPPKSFGCIPSDEVSEEDQRHYTAAHQADCYDFPRVHRSALDRHGGRERSLVGFEAVTAGGRSVYLEGEVRLIAEGHPRLPFRAKGVRGVIMVN